MSTDLIVPDNPKHGVYGKQIILKSNFFRLTSLPLGIVMKYEISISPVVPPRKNRSIYQIWINECFENLRPVYDGKNTVYSTALIPDGSFVVCFYDNSLDGIKCDEDKEPKLPQHYQLMIRKVKDIDMGNLIAYLKCNSGECPLEEINVIETVLRHAPAQSYTNIGKCFYSSTTAFRIDQGVELWQGFYSSLQPTDGCLLINLDVSAGAFFQSGSLLETVISVLGFNSPSNLNFPISESDRNKLERHLRNLKVNVIHRGVFRKKFQILQLTTQGADNLRFVNGNNEEQSVTNYFAERYKFTLRYGHLPCIVHKTSAGLAFLPLEVCKIVPGQRYMRRLNELQTADMIKETCQAPLVRSNKISTGISTLHLENDEYLQDFNISFSPEMITVNARILPAPLVQYHNESKESAILPQLGAWNLRDKKFVEGIALISWSVVIFGDENKYSVDEVKNFITTLCSVFSSSGISVENPTPPFAFANPCGNIENILTDAHIMAQNSYRQKTQIIFCVLPNNGISLYAEIKRVSDTILGVVTQCIQGKHIFKPKVQFCANLALKVNAKLGGQNSKLPHSSLPLIFDLPTIILGADITHSGPGSSSGFSITSIVGSIDSQFCKYASVIRYQDASVEYIHDLSEMVLDLLKTFFKSTGSKPQRIIMYRNGILLKRSRIIASQEIRMLRNALNDLDVGYKPQITYICVQKRHHAKFFPPQSEKSRNIIPGTLIDSDITLPGEFDFYLASHPGLQGTSRPSYYHVVHDENDFSPDSLQKLTYNLCYLYCRATRSISVIPALYYAHLVGLRARYHAQPNKGNNEFSRAINDQCLEEELSAMQINDKNQLSGQNTGITRGLSPELYNSMYFM